MTRWKRLVSRYNRCVLKNEALMIIIQTFAETKSETETETERKRDREIEIEATPKTEILRSTMAQMVWIAFILKQRML
jgi:hypothetical protein